MAELDCRDEVFIDRGYEVLGSVVQATQMAQPDPLDVGQLHADARRAFDETLAQVRGDARSRILLIRGEAGCGKTHLIRSLRAQAHGQRAGVIAYVHMTAEHGDYRQYLLRQVIRSLSDPYDLHAGSAHASALDLISDALCHHLEEGAAEKLREADDVTLAQLVTDDADALSEAADVAGQPIFDGVSLNTLRIFLYRQSTRKPIQRRVGSFLNGEPLGDMDWQKLAALPRDCDRGAMHMLGELARVIGAALGMPLIVCVDQIEASDITGSNHTPFVNAMATACELAENVAGMMVLLACLDSAYDSHAPSLIGSYRHRIENEPSAVRLVAVRDADEIRQILSRRLRCLFEGVGLEHIPSNSVYPLPETLPEQLTAAGRQQLRRVLQQVHGYWEQCHHSGQLVEWGNGQVVPAPAIVEPDVDRLRIAWNEYRTSSNQPAVEDDDQQIALLAWAFEQIAHELEEGTVVRVERSSAGAGEAPVFAFALNVEEPRTEPKARLVGLCDKDPRGGGLANQIAALEKLRTAGQRLAVTRSTKFSSKGQAGEMRKRLLAAGEVFVTIDDAAWRSLQAMRSFLAQTTFSAQVLREWRKTDRPLASMPEIASILEAKRLKVEKAAAKTPASPPKAEAPKPQPVAIDTPLAPPVIPISAPSSSGSSSLLIGHTDGITHSDILIDPQTLTRHTAIFGANGSGKTVLALAIVEMLLERGVGVVLFDRKGDLASYALDEAWTSPTGAPDEFVRRPALRQRIDIHLYTPGCPTGRPLVLPLLPRALSRLAEDDRQEQARQAATILCDVCAPSAAKSDLFTTVLCKAIELLCAGDAPRTLDDLQHVLLDAPQELLDLLPAHGSKHCEEVGRRLNERRVAHGRLFSDQGEKLDLDRMLRSRAGRAPLNIISTQFLDDDAALIWVAQFLAAAGRFIRESPSPDGSLQALLMFDEADVYIPANRKPATKPGLENLLRRARAAGVGIMLASQNVGDFDYRALDNITTAFAGKLTTQRALEKLRPRLGESVNKLAKKSAGQFVLGIETQVREIRGQMSLIRPQPIPRDQIERLAARQPA